MESQIRVVMFDDRIEIFGAGIIRIKQLYELALVKPDFEVSENAIRIVLPVFEMDLDLTDDERIKAFSFGIAL